MTALNYEVPTLSVISSVTKEAFEIRPCRFQLDSIQIQLEKKLSIQSQAVICLAPTGSGKSLAFVAPLLFNDNGISILITPLNILGTHTTTKVDGYNISVANTTGPGVCNTLYKVRTRCIALCIKYLK